jgi:hypothetical protein
MLVKISPSPVESAVLVGIGASVVASGVTTPVDGPDTPSVLGGLGSVGRMSVIPPVIESRILGEVGASVGSEPAVVSGGAVVAGSVEVGTFEG